MGSSCRLGCFARYGWQGDSQYLSQLVQKMTLDTERKKEQGKIKRHVNLNRVIHNSHIIHFPSRYIPYPFLFYFFILHLSFYKSEEVAVDRNCTEK